MFTGFPEETIQFFLSLRFNNQLSFFDAHKEEYLRHVQAPFYAFIDQMAPIMRNIDPAMEVRPAKCLARIRRDTRFTKDKSPFRDHLWLLFRKASEPRDGSLMYWFEVSPEEVNWGLGFWGENRPAMDMMRRRMAATPRAFLELIEQCHLPEHSLFLGGDAFKRMAIPEQIPPALKPWYLAKHFYVQRSSTHFPWIYSSDIVKHVAEDYQCLAPLYRTFRGMLDDLASVQE